MGTRKAGPVASFFIGLVMVACGGGFGYFFAWPDYQMAKESEAWPQTSGKVIRSKVSSHRNDDGQTMYKADILYSYEVNGRRYESTSIYVGSGGLSTSSSDSAYEYTNKFPEGSQAKVFYSPTISEKAVLEPGVQFIHTAFLGIAAVLILGGLALSVVALIKIAVFGAMVAGLLGAVFKKKKTSSPPPSSPSTKKKFGFKGSAKASAKSLRAVTSSGDKDLDEPRLETGVEQNLDTGMDIDLDEEMQHFNKVSASNMSTTDAPWNHKWMIKGVDKDFGPYTYEEIAKFHEKGKLKDSHPCYSTANKKLLEVSDIIPQRKAS